MIGLLMGCMASSQYSKSMDYSVAAGESITEDSFEKDNDGWAEDYEYGMWPYPQEGLCWFADFTLNEGAYRAYLKISGIPHEKKKSLLHSSGKKALSFLSIKM